MFFLTGERGGAYNAGAAFRGMKPTGAAFLIMLHNNTPTKVVTILAIVWYVLEIILKTVQLLR